MNARCDELCEAILASADIAVEYWADDFRERLQEARVMEAKLLGAQSLFDGLYAELRSRFSLKEAGLIDSLMSDLLDSLTGGLFTVEGRPADAERTQRSAQSASQVVVALRRAHHSTMPFSSLSRAADANRHRVLDMPRGWRRG